MVKLGNLVRSLAVAGCAAALAIGPVASAQASSDFPSKPVRIVVGFAPGFGIDAAARFLADEMSRQLPQPVVVENRPGAGGVISADYVARSEADGHTLVFTAPGLAVVSHHLRDDLPYGLDDLASVSLIGLVPLVLITHPGSGYETLTDFIEAARAAPGTLTVGTAGVGTSNHMALVLLEMMADIDLVHIPYDGAEGRMDLMGGNIDAVIDASTTAAEYIRDGRVVALAITTDTRTPALPDVPTVVEAGGPEGYFASNWYGLAAPAGTPSDVIAILNDAVAASVAQPELLERFEEMGVITRGTSAEEYQTFVEEQYEIMGELVARVRAEGG